MHAGHAHDVHEETETGGYGDSTTDAVEAVGGSHGSSESAKQAGHVAAQCQAANYANRFVIVVDDDIDVSNLEQLIWAMCTRCDPATATDLRSRCVFRRQSCA